MNIHLPWPRLRGLKRTPRRRADNTAATAAPPVRDPLVAIPLRPANVELRRDSAGCLQLRARLQVDGWRARIGRWLRYDFCRTVALDANGTCFYELVDDARTLHAIARALAAPLNRGVAECERAVILYTRDLMRRGFLDLKVPAPSMAALSAKDAARVHREGVAP